MGAATEFQLKMGLTLFADKIFDYYAFCCYLFYTYDKMDHAVKRLLWAVDFEIISLNPFLYLE